VADIDFVIFLTKHSLEYANFLRLTGESLKSGKHNIYWKCVLSNKSKIVPDNYECINRVSFNSKNASLRHGLTINSILPKISSDYVVISDVDIAITYKNWDDEIVKVLDDGFSCFGAENIRREREPLHYPNVPFFCFDKNVMKKIDIDFTPMMENGDIKRSTIKTSQEAEFFGRDIGEVVIFNTGSRLHKDFKEAGFKGRHLPSVLVRSKDIQLKFNSDEERDSLLNDKISQRNLVEFHYNGEVFLTHLGRSHKRNFKVGYVKNWADRIKRYIKIKYSIDI
jgi:hypothetical protein